MSFVFLRLEVALTLLVARLLPALANTFPTA
jgi:hypothetical protein